MHAFIESDGGRLNGGFPNEPAGDCVARAIAHASGLPYAPIWRKLACLNEEAGLTCSADDGVSPDEDGFEPYLKSLGFRFVKRGIMWGEDLPEKGRFLIFMRGHAAALVNGVWLDTWDSRERCIYRLWEYRPR